jgi:hemerythrin
MKIPSDLIWQDKQHEVLFELIDRIASNNADETVFTRLLDYAENHFTVEEAYMVQLDYPEAPEHVRAHQKFREELQSLVDDCPVYDQAVNDSLSLFLSEWLKRHIRGLDKKLERFIMASEFK